MKHFTINKINYSVISIIGLLIIIAGGADQLSAAAAFASPGQLFLAPPPDSITGDDTTRVYLPYPLENDIEDPDKEHGLFLKKPANIESEFEYDPETNQYIYKQQIGDSIQLRRPRYMTLDEYRKYELENAISSYWEERAQAAGAAGRDGIIPSIYIGGKAFDRIFGGNTIDIRPQGSAEITFGVLSTYREDPALDVQRRRQTNFDFQEKIQMNVLAKIGDKIEFKTNYNTEATFEFENKLKLKYEGDEDEIIKLIEAGDVNLPLNSTLITGSQSLFGIKTKLQFGRMTITSVFSEQESETSTITVQGGATTNDFYFKADEYEENKHFFLSHYFRQNYQNALSELPLIKSGIEIQKIEVWVTNVGAAVTENRNIAAFADLGEYYPYIHNEYVEPTTNNTIPDNGANNLISQMNIGQLRNLSNVSNYLKNDPYNIGQTGYFVSGEDFEKVEKARKLNQNEYTLNSKLGFISLNTTINPDQVLAVAFQYSIIGQDSVFQVGEFSDQGITDPDVLIVKLLKSTAINTDLPMWDLMMKNVYSLNAYQVNREDFTLNILYSGGDNGVPTGYFTDGPEEISGKPLIQVFNLDNLDNQQNRGGDGVFDFLDNAASQGGTINSSNGRIYFTVLEPFGSYLKDKFTEYGAEELGEKYAYTELYNMTKTEALENPSKNKFIIEGFYKSASGSEISLNALNIPQGSVKVTAGGTPLAENVDYIVDYTLGRVKIINEGILNSGTPINISMESNTLFSIQTKRLIGTHIDYEVNRDLHLGATVMNLTESPLTQKVNYGDDPISNTIYGVDFSYQTESRFITKLVDKIPLISTKQQSIVTVDGEFAHFLPGHSRKVGKTGTSYIDDFEGSKSTIDLRNVGYWFLASTPQGQDEAGGLFPEAAPVASNLDPMGRRYGFNRAKVAWYQIDPTVFYDRNGNLRPPNIDNNELSKNSVRQVLETEVFPNRDLPNGTPTNLPVFNVAYYPAERGPYNYDVGGTSVSSGINEDGSLKNPESRWGGIMRQIDQPDFEAANVEYIEFWMMDPFADNPDNAGQLYFNLGDVSEDILRDSRKSFENGLPTTEVIEDVDTTIWGHVPEVQALVESFDNDPDSRLYQDVGYDGLRDEDEQSFYQQDYVQQILNTYGANSQAYTNAVTDPSSDNYHYFRGSDYDQNAQYRSILERYKDYNNPDGNSVPDELDGEAYATAATTIPNKEDLNDDNTLSEAERYFQYMINLDPDQMEVGENYIADVYNAQGIPLANGDVGNVKWYQFKIPIRNPDKVVGNIQDFKSIRFMRMFMRGFEQPVVLRFATFDLVRGEWRRYSDSEELLAPGEYLNEDAQNLTSFDVTAVNIEENGQRVPIPYVIPPGIEREINLGTTNLTRLNEQSMVMKVCELIDGDARAVYKTADFDFRQYKNLKMFVHAEKTKDYDQLKDGDLTLFMRLGADFTENYYEYEIPLEFTPWGTSNPNAIWPKANELNLELDRLVQAKVRRNEEISNGNSEVAINFPYYVADGKNKITIMGVPSISDVQAIMIGVRNPKKTSLTSDDDGEPKCAEIWVNEFRLTDFNNKGGWASTARVSTDLADFGNLTLSGSYSSPGFGSIDKKVNETQKEAISQFDIATNLELGKFFGEKSGIRIPLHYDYSEARIAPQYNPLDPDVEMKQQLDKLDTKEERDSLRELTQDFTQRKNINFINVRKDKVGGGKSKNRLYDISNFDLSYSYSLIYHRNIDIEYDRQKTYTGGLGYNFQNNPKSVKPFEGVGLFNKYKVFKLIQDFNFYYLPKLISFRTDMTRMYNEKKLRKKSAGDVITFPTFSKDWDWNRIYNVKWDLAQSLQLDFTATANAFIDEPRGSLNKDDPDYDDKRDTIIDEIFGLGTLERYTQTFTANYNVPINKFPLLDWINLQATYQSNYQWMASPQAIQDAVGNNIENANTKQLNSNVDFVKLYNKIDYLKKLNQPKRNQPKGNAPQRGKRTGDGSQKQDTAQAKEEKEKINIPKLILDNTLRVMMGLRKVSVNYSVSDGTAIPGFRPTPTAIGNDWNQDAPGLPFIFGDQSQDLGYFRKWITDDSTLNSPYMFKHNENLDLKATFEPIRDLKIDIQANRSYSENEQGFYVADEFGEFQRTGVQQTGTFSMSYFTWPTAFGGSLDDDKSKYFEDLKQYRFEVAQRLARENPDWQDSPQYVDSTGFPVGYGPTSQQVLLPSFLAAYSGNGPDKITLENFPSIPKPNWRITYNGLSKIELLKSIFKSVTLSHSYLSTYSIGSFATNQYFKEEEYRTNDIGNYYPKYDINQVTISEQFSPLVGLDLTLHNSLLTKFEIKKSRNLSLSFVNNQLTEVSSNEFIIGVGYRFEKLPFSFSGAFGGRKKTVESDLNLKFDFAIRDNQTVLRRIDIDQDQISAGQQIVNIKVSADYMINQNINMRLFYDRTVNNPYLASNFKNSTTNAGISLRFSLAQ